MKNAMQLLLIFTTLGLSLLVIQSYSSIVDSSNAQQQNETTNQTQMQSQENMSETKFLKNSTSFGNATADLRIKHAPEFSTLTIQPWPIVEPGKEFNITAYWLKITLQPIPNSDISFLYESASQAISPSNLEAIDKQSADTGGKFNAKTNAPDSQGIVSVTAVYNGSGLYHSVASDPALVIVSNSSLPP
jgi:Tfp pilus assembly protein PilE